MSDPVLPDSSPRPTSLLARVFFFIAGVVALAIGTVITLGAALGGAIVIAIAAWRLRRNGRRLTRRGAWFAAVTGTIGILALVTGYSVIHSQPPRPLTAGERAEQRQRATEAMPDWLRAMNPNAQRQTATADSMAAQLLENRAVMVWAGLMGAVIASALIGTIAGSFAWGGAMLLYRCFYRDWMPASVAEPGGL